MTAYITWKDYYSVGDKKIDAQHKQIIDIINELWDAMLHKKDQQVLKSLLDRLVLYTFNHFEFEEEVQQACAYPDFQQHKALHDKMRKKTIDLRERASQVTAHDLLVFLKEWWLEHVQGDDKKYQPYLTHSETAVTHQDIKTASLPKGATGILPVPDSSSDATPAGCHPPSAG